jgi:hypothetical protein
MSAKSGPTVEAQIRLVYVSLAGFLTSLVLLGGLVVTDRMTNQEFADCFLIMAPVTIGYLTIILTYWGIIPTPSGLRLVDSRMARLSDRAVLSIMLFIYASLLLVLLARGFGKIEFSVTKALIAFVVSVSSGWGAFVMQSYFRAER